MSPYVYVRRRVPWWVLAGGTLVLCGCCTVGLSTAMGTDAASRLPDYSAASSTDSFAQALHDAGLRDYRELYGSQRSLTEAAYYSHSLGLVTYQRPKANPVALLEGQADVYVVHSFDKSIEGKVLTDATIATPWGAIVTQINSHFKMVPAHVSYQPQAPDIDPRQDNLLWPGTTVPFNTSRSAGEGARWSVDYNGKKHNVIAELKYMADYRLNRWHNRKGFYALYDGPAMRIFDSQDPNADEVSYETLLANPERYKVAFGDADNEFQSRVANLATVLAVMDRTWSPAPRFRDAYHYTEGWDLDANPRDRIADSFAEPDDSTREVERHAALGVTRDELLSRLRHALPDLGLAKHSVTDETTAPAAITATRQRTNHGTYLYRIRSLPLATPASPETPVNATSVNATPVSEPDRHVMTPPARTIPVAT